jgi:hypothetical protein
VQFVSRFLRLLLTEPLVVIPHCFKHRLAQLWILWWVKEASTASALPVCRYLLRQTRNHVGMVDKFDDCWDIFFVRSWTIPEGA